MAKADLNNNRVWQNNNKYANQALNKIQKKNKKVKKAVTKARKAENEKARKSGSPQRYSNNSDYLKSKETSGQGGGTYQSPSKYYQQRQQQKKERAQKILNSTTYSRLDPNSYKAKSIREDAGYTAEADKNPQSAGNQAKTLEKKEYQRAQTGEAADTSKMPVRRGTANLAQAATKEQKDTIAYQLNQLKAANESAGSKVKSKLDQKVQQEYVDKINAKARKQMQEKYGDEYDFANYEAVSYDAAAGDYRLNYTGSQQYDAATGKWSYDGGQLLRDADTMGSGYGSPTSGTVNTVGAQVATINDRSNQAQWAATHPQEVSGAGERLMNAASAVGGMFNTIIPQAFGVADQMEADRNGIRTNSDGDYVLTEAQAAAYERNKRLGVLTGNIALDTSYDAGEASRRYQILSEDQERALDGLNGWQRFLGETGISIANSAASILAGTLVGGPAGSAVSLGLMGLQAGAQKSYDKQQDGATGTQALIAGLISGGIEVATEKIPLDNLFSNKTPFRKFWSQIAIEAAEEGESYVANAIADRLQGDKDASIELDELALNALGGAISGAAFGGVAAGASKISSMASDARARQELGAIEEYADGKMQERMADFAVRYGEDALDDAVDNIVTRTENTLAQAADKAQYSVRDTSDTSARVQTAANKSTDAKSIYPMLETAGREAYGTLSARERTDSASVQEFVKLYRAGLESKGAAWESVKGALTVEKLKNPEAIYQAGQRDGGALTTAAEEDSEFVRAATEALGLRVQTEELPEGINGYIQGDTLHLNRTARATETVAHEITHELQKKAPREYEAFKQYVIEGLADEAESIRAKREQYGAHGITLSEAEAMDEIVAEHAQKLVRDSKAIREYVKTNGVSRGRQMWERIKTAFRSMIDKLTGRAKSEAQRELNRAERLWTKAFDRAAKNTEKAQKKTADVGGGNARYWINPAFEKQIDEWAKNQSNRSFLLGGTSKILKEIGVKGQEIRFRSGKLRRILTNHPEMTLETIKQIPKLLESPVIVMESLTKPGRLVIYGELYDSHGSPVAAVLELQPKNRRSGEIEEFAILASAYGKDSNLARQILRSKIIYLSKNKKRTNHWLQGLRLQLPSHDTNVGSIGRITYEEGGVKVEGVRGLDVFVETSEENPRYSAGGHNTDAYDFTKDFAAQVDDWIRGAFPKNDALVIGGTPTVLQELGLSALPMTINQKHVDYVINGTKNADHAMGTEMLKQLPEAMKKPVAVIASQTQGENSVVVILELRHNGKQVIAPVHISGNGWQYGATIDTNAVSSVYARKNALTKLMSDALLDEANGKTSVFYWNKKRTISLFAGARVTMPKSAYNLENGSLHMITDAGTPVKQKITTQTQSRQFRRWFGKSKVVNEDGTPRVVYHGTNQDFEAFHAESGAYWFSESYDYAESMMEERGGGKVVECYLRMENPYEVKMNPRDFAVNTAEERRIIQRAKTNGHDGVIIVNDTDNEIEADTFYVVFDGKQIKSATDNRGTFDRNTDKIRYSIESQEDKIARLERELAAAKAELKRTPTEDVSLEVRDDRKSDTGETVTRTTKPFAVKDHKAIGRMATELRRDYQSTYNKDDLTDDIQALYDIMQLNPETRDSAEVRELAVDIAGSILDGSQVLNDEMARNYKDLRQDLRKTAVTVLEEDREDFADGWASFRREARGLVSFKADGMPVDTKYAELTERYPKLFPEDITHPADQARQMVDVARELKPFYENLYENDMEEVSNAIAGDILERFEDTPDYQTYADKMNARLAREKAKGAERLEKQKERAAEKLEREQTKSAEKAAAAMQRLEKRKNREIDRLQERIERQKQRREELRRQREKTAAKHKAIELVNKLATTYAKPSKEKYVPELYRKAVGSLLKSLDMESQKGFDERWRLQTVTDENAEQLTPTSTTEKWRNLLEMVKAIESQKDVFAEGQEDALLGFDPSLVTLDPNLVDNIQAVIRIDKNINQYNEGELELLHNTIAALNKSIESYAQTSAAFQRAKITDLGDKLIQDNGKGGTIREKNAAGKMMVDNLQAWDFLHRLGEVGDRTFDALHDGMDEKIRLTRKYQELTKEAMEGDSGSKRKRAKRMKAAQGWMQDKAKTYQLDSGEAVSLTTAQIMSLYRYTKDEQALKHLLRSGIKEGSVKQKGKLSEKQTSGTGAHELTENDIERLIGTLTAEQKQVADDLHKVMNQMAEDGNKVTVRRYGYQMFTNENYFPIKSYGVRETQTEQQRQADMNAVNHLGMLKTRQKMVSSAIELNSFFDLYYQHFDEMTQFIAFGEAMEDINRIYNYKQRKFSEKDALQVLSRTVQNTTAQDAIKQRFGGKVGTDYFEKLMVDINGGIDYKGQGTALLNKLLRNFKAAAVGANLSVIVQQPFSYLRAAAVYNPLRMLRALPAGARSVFEKGAFERAVAHSPIAWWKQQGHYELDIARSMQEELLGTSKLREVGESVMFGAAGRADSLAWGQLWAATEYEVQAEYKKADRRSKRTRTKAEYKELFDSPEYWDKCNRKFRMMVARTQVVDSTLHRSGLMRSNDTMMKSLTSFMSEPTKSFNLLSTTIWDAMRNPSARNMATVARVTTAFTVSALMTTLAKSMIGAMRDKDEDKDERTMYQRVLEHWLGLTYDEMFGREEFNTASLLLNSNLAGEMNPITMIPLVNEIWGLLEYDEDKGKVAVSTWGHSYKTDSLFQNIGRVLNSAAAVMDELDTPGMTDQTLFAALSDLIGRAADSKGIPLTAFKRDLSAAVNSVLRALDENPQLQALEKKAGIKTDFAKIRYDLKTLTKNFNDANKKDWITLAYSYEQDGREDLAQDIYERLLGAGVSMDDIDNALKKLQLASAPYKREERHARTEMNQMVKDRLGWSALTADEQARIMSDEDSIINKIAENTAKTALHMEVDTPKWIEKYNSVDDAETKADLLVMYGTANPEKIQGSQLDTYLWLEVSDYSAETKLKGKDKQKLWDAYGGWKTSYADYKAAFEAEYGKSKSAARQMYEQLRGTAGTREEVTADSILESLDPDGTKQGQESATTTTKSGSYALGRARRRRSRRSGGSSGGRKVAAAADWEGAAHINVGSSSQEVAAALSRSKQYAKLSPSGQAKAREYAAQIASGSASSSYIANAVNARGRYGVSTANYLALTSKYGAQAVQSARAQSAGGNGVLPQYLDSYKKLKNYESKNGNNNGYFDMTETRNWLGTQSGLSQTQKAALFDAWFPKAKYNPYR